MSNKCLYFPINYTKNYMKTNYFKKKLYEDKIERNFSRVRHRFDSNSIPFVIVKGEIHT